MKLVVYTDGGAVNNPGPAAIAYIIYRDGEVVLQGSEKIGFGTNNVAEYRAVIKALEEIRTNFPEAQKITFFSDSRLLVNQLNGVFRVKNGQMRELIMKIRILEGEIGAAFVYKNIPREENRRADALVKKELF